MTERCFACDKEATSREHAPPLCIFPETKDLPGTSYRENLITVPSCDDHNLRKSKDDEYLMMILVAHFENNQVANAQMASKVRRAWQRRPHLATMVVKNPSPARLNGEETLAFQVDSARFNRAMELIARAVSIHDCKRKWPDACLVWSPSMLPSNPVTEQNVLQKSQFLLEALPHIFHDRPLQGSNPDIFQFRIHVPEQADGLGLVHLIFYGAFQVCVMFGQKFTEAPKS